jgi:hypothetical protein
MSISDSEAYKLDVNNFLGNKYSAYKQRVLQFSIANPSEFLALREDVIAIVKTRVVENFYSQIFSLLGTGKVCDSDGNPTGNSIINLPGVSEENKSVSYPKQEINNLAISIASTIDDFLDKICNILIPTDYLENVKNSFITKSKAAIVNG